MKMHKYKKKYNKPQLSIQMVLFIVEFFANVKRFGFFVFLH